MDVPMLDESEWQVIEPLLVRAIEDMKRYCHEHGVSLTEAQRSALGASALAKYKEFTGFGETNINTLWHHRASLYGQPCIQCGKPLRTPNASYCAECGHAAA